jgi:PAS domain S-box-containing protein
MINPGKYEKIFNVLPMPLFVVFSNRPMFTIAAVNDAYLKLTNLSDKELLGRGFMEFSAISTSYELLRWRKSMLRVLKSKSADKISTQMGVRFSNDHAIRTKHFDMTNVPMVDQAGEVTHIVCTFFDLTEHIHLKAKNHSANEELNSGGHVNLVNDKEDNLQLIEAHEQCQSILRNVNGILWEMNVETQELVFTNEQPKPILGYSQAEWQASPGFWKRRLHPHDREIAADYFRLKHYKTDKFDFECRMACAKGRYVWLKHFISVIAEKGKPVMLRGLMVDISDLKRLNAFAYFEKKIWRLHAKKGLSTPQLLTAFLLGLEEMLPELRCSIHEVKHQRIFNWAAPSLPMAYIQAMHGLTLGKSLGTCGASALLKKAVIVPNIVKDLQWLNTRYIALAANLQACWSYPIMNAEREVLATLGCYCTTPRLPNQDEELIIHQANSLLKIILGNRILIEEEQVQLQLVKNGQQLAKFGTWSWDTNLNVLVWSDSMYAMYGIDKADCAITFEGYLSCLHQDDKERVSAGIGGVLSTKKGLEFEERIILPDGAIRKLKSWCALNLDNQGNTIGMYGACLDITEIKNREEQLLANEKLLRNLTDAQTNFVIRVDLSGKYTYCNQKYEEIFSWRALGEKLIGSECLKTVVPHDIQHAFNVAEQCLMQPNIVFQIALDKVAGDGRVLHTLWDLVCLTDEQGCPREIQGTGMDITAWKENMDNLPIGKKQLEWVKLESSAVFDWDNVEGNISESKLQVMHKRYHAFFQYSPQPMWVYEVDTLRFVDVNEAAMKCYGYSREEFLSANTEMNRLAEDMHRYLKVMESASQEKNMVFQGVFRHQKKNGELLHMDIRSKPIKFNDKDTYLVLASDITDKLNYFEGIKRQNEKFREVAWMQSQVVRAPLTRMMSLIDLLKKEESVNSDQDKLFDYLLTSALELDEIVKDISIKTPKVE